MVRAGRGCGQTKCGVGRGQTKRINKEVELVIFRHISVFTLSLFILLGEVLAYRCDFRLSSFFKETNSEATHSYEQE